jgi:phage-related protein
VNAGAEVERSPSWRESSKTLLHTQQLYLGRCHARKVAWTLRLVERLDRVPQQYLKKLLGTDDLWEIRIQTSGRSYRLLGFFDGPLLMILTSGFAKKQQKIPVRELDLARQRRTDYLQRRKTP